MTSWDDVRTAIEGTLEQYPGALTGYPDPRSDRKREPPFGMELSPWATGVAAELKASFGPDVKLRVGWLGYPNRTLEDGCRDDSSADLDPTEIGITLDSVLVVRSGYRMVGGLLLHNLTGQQLRIMTNGQLTALVVDPRTDAVVGCDALPQHMPGVPIDLEPGTTTRIPLLVGTSSCVPALGYAIPPGQWAVRTSVNLGEGHRLRTPPLPLTVVA